MDFRILHRDISYSNLLLTRSELPSGSAPLATGLLIDFDYAQQLQPNADASNETVILESSLKDFNTRASTESSSSRGMIPSLSSSTSDPAGGDPQVPSTPDRKAVNSGADKAIAGNQRTVSLHFLIWIKITNVNPITREHLPSCLSRASSRKIQNSLRKPVTTSSHSSISSYICVPSRTVQMIRSSRKKFLTRVHCANGSRRPPKHLKLVSSKLDTCSVLTSHFCPIFPNTGTT